MAYKHELILRLQLGGGMITIGGPGSPYCLLSSGLAGMEAPETVVQTKTVRPTVPRCWRFSILHRTAH